MNRSLTSMESWKHKRVLVTGGDGFIGSHLVPQLIERGATVCITSNRMSPPWRLENYEGKYQRAPLTLPDALSVQSLFETFQPEIVFHLAGVLPSSGGSTQHFLQVHVEGTRALYQTAGAERLTHFVMLGSAAEYGPIDGALTEELEPKANSDYGRSKLLATMFLKESARENCRTTVLRPCAVYGGAQGFGMFIPDCIRACIEKTPFPMTLGEQRIDFIYVKDLVEAMVAAGTRQKGDAFEICNVGPGTPVQVRDLAYLIARTLAAEENLQMGAKPYRPHEPYTRYLSIEKARGLLSWEPSTSLVDGLNQAIDWYRTNRDKFQYLVS